MPRYEKVCVAELPDAPGPSSHKKEVDEAVGASRLDFNVYTAKLGEQIPHGYHLHTDYEEIFYVIEGAVRFETGSGEFEVRADDAFYVGPESPQRSVASSDSPAVVVAVGGPRANRGGTVIEVCSECGEETRRTRTYESTPDGIEVAVLSCAECGVETTRYTPGPDYIGE